MRYLVISVLTSIYLLWGWLVYKERNTDKYRFAENMWTMLTLFLLALLLGYLGNKGTDYILSLIE